MGDKACLICKCYREHDESGPQDLFKFPYGKTYTQDQTKGVLKTHMEIIPALGEAALKKKKKMAA